MTGNPYHALADKIEEGCKLSEPMRHGFVRHIGDTTAACALGAAALACDPKADGRKNPTKLLKDCAGVDIQHTYADNPVAFGFPTRSSLEQIIVSLNDTYHWRREEISAWLRTLPNP